MAECKLSRLRRKANFFLLSHFLVSALKNGEPFRFFDLLSSMLTILLVVSDSNLFLSSLKLEFYGLRFLLSVTHTQSVLQIC